MNQYYGAYPPQSLTPQQAAALGGWQNNQNLQQMQGMGIQNGYPQQFVQAIPGRMIHDIQEVRPNEVPNNGTVAIFPKDDMSCVCEVSIECRENRNHDLRSHGPDR